MILPAYIVRPHAVGAGKRLPHLEHVEPHRSSWESRTSSLKGNIPHGDYRYFKGSKFVQSDYTNCRACNKYLSSKRERDEHKNTESCCGVLDAAYRFMMEPKPGDRVCIVCGKPTVELRWGIPMHGGAKDEKSCESIFKFELGDYSHKDEALQYAIRVVKNRAFKKQKEYEGRNR